MALNPFARRRPDGEVGPADSASSTPAATATGPAAEEGDSKPASTRSRRGTRGGRRTRSTASRSTSEAEDKKAKAGSDASSKSTRSTTRRASRSRAKPADAAEKTGSVEPESPAKSATRTRRSSSASKAGEPDLTALAKAIEQQTQEIEALRKALAAQADRADRADPDAVATSEQRVGVFVDAANAEKGREERRVSLDWRLVLKRLVAGRRITRAVAYAPISDDPGVSIETQRFVEPFLDSGYRVVTKPLKRFQGGAIKANLDIEIALDVMQMLDRLDVVCLVSGDGDFEPLVEAVQGRGVRVEVASFPHNTAGNLRHAADEFVDLSRIKS